MPTMTAQQITTEIDIRRDRIRELTATEQALETSLTSGRNAIATAIARSRDQEADVVRESVRSDSDRLAETKNALELLNRECAECTAQLKKAVAREANERATQSAADARAAIDVVRTAVHEAAAKIGELAHAARMAMDQANSDSANARSMNGLPVIGIGEVHLPAGLEDVLHQIQSYAHRQEVSPTGPPMHVRVV